MRGGGQAAAELGAEESACGEIPLVFECAGDGPVTAFVEEQGGGIGIVHRLRAPVALQDGVETVGERVVGLAPPIGIGDVGSAGEAQEPLVQAEPGAAHEALPRHQHVARRAEERYDRFLSHSETPLDHERGHQVRGLHQRRDENTKCHALPRDRWDAVTLHAPWHKPLGRAPLPMFILPTYGGLEADSSEDKTTKGKTSRSVDNLCCFTS